MTDKEKLEKCIDMLKSINGWLVCSCLTTPEDMAQSFEPFFFEIEELLKEIE